MSEFYLTLNESWLAVRDQGLAPSEAAKLIDLPEWWSLARDMGGAGIIPPGSTTELTLHLEPGTYVLDCYLKSEEGEIHTMEGMARELIVTDTPSNGTPPEANIQVTLLNDQMVVEGDLTAGSHTVQVRALEGRGHTVHVARLEHDTDVQEVVEWMSWLERDGLKPSGSAAFVGGMHRMPEGGTAYFTVDLEPGRYLFISQYTARDGVLQEVVIGQ